MKALREFAKLAARKRKYCTAKDISDKSVRGVTTKCMPIFGLKIGRSRKKRLGEEPASTMPPSGSVEIPGKDLEASPTGK